MNSIQNNLQEANDFIQTSKSLNRQRNQLVEQLTLNIIYLDGTKATPQRREMIHKIQNVIHRLEHLYDELKQ